MRAPWRRSADSRRRRALAKAPEGALTAYLSVPFPQESATIAETEFLALDLETTGLTAGKDRILSVGYVPVIGGRVVLAGARSLVVAADGEVGHSATVHGLTDDAIAAGVSLEEAVGEVLGALAGRVLLAHYAVLEQGFLAAACERVWQGPFVCAVADTMEIQRGLLSRGFHDEPAPGALRLWAARARHGLPVYRAHDALVDALSCAELFLAQVAELAAAGGGNSATADPGGVRLDRVLTRG